MTSPFARRQSGEELMDEETFSKLYSRIGQRAERPRAESPPPAPRTAPRQQPYAPAVLEAEIGRSISREDVARLTVRLACSYASAAALLLVHRGMIQGLCAGGLPGRADAVLFPAGEASVFAEVAASGRAFRGAPRAGGLDARILRALGREHVREIAVLPVRLSGRVVNLLYSDNGSEALGDVSAAALTAVCTHVAAAYERLIREHRLRAQAQVPSSPSSPRSAAGPIGLR